MVSGRLLHVPAAALWLSTLAVPALAQTNDAHGMGHGAMDHGAMGTPPAGSAYSDAMDTMMQAMDGAELTGEPDADFLLLMIPHHQSAVDMARALLEQSDDAEVSALAQAVIDTQEAEIAEMKGMLARLGHPVE